jgi:hypothetical protein
MSVRSGRTKRKHQNRNATIQWLALALVAALSLLAAFILLGDDPDASPSLPAISPAASALG